jgi:hypothetical protein
MTIGATGEVVAWWLLEPALAQQHRAMLDQLEGDPGLKAAVRALVHAEAIIRSSGDKTSEKAA